MAKKKSSTKKHKFKYSEPAGVGATSVEEAQAVPAATQRPVAGPVRPALSNVRTAAGGQAERDFSYVSGDLRRIGIFAVSLVGVEMVLYYLMSHTGLNSAINSLIKL